MNQQRLSARRRGDLSRELREFFLCQPSGIESNYAGIANMALSGVRTSGGSGFDSGKAILRLHRIQRSVGHNGRVQRALLSLPDEHLDALCYAFGASALAPQVHSKLGETAGAALLTKAAHEGCQKAAGAVGEPSREQLGRWLLRCAATDDAEALRAVREERDALVEVALCAYAAARRAQGERAMETASGERKRASGARRPSNEVPFLFPEG